MARPDAAARWVRLPLEGAVNVRDIGGYPTSDGRMTAYHRFLRSDALDSLTPADEDFLYDYGVRTVIDLRGDEEAALAPDRLVERPDVAYHHFSLLSGNIADPEYLSRQLNERISPKHVYQTAVDNLERMGGALRAMVEAAPGCVLFHCAVGKDRTGIVAMLLMRLAGCDADDCMANYVVSEINLRRDASFMRDYEAAEDWERPFFESRPWILQGAVDRIESVYGGVVPYLRAVGLDEGEVAALRARVLGD